MIEPNHYFRIINQVLEDTVTKNKVWPKSVYIAKWDDNYDNPRIEIHTLPWFNEDNGYTPEAIGRINRLCLDDKYSPEPGHTVTKIY